MTQIAESARETAPVHARSAPRLVLSAALGLASFVVVAVGSTIALTPRGNIVGLLIVAAGALLTAYSTTRRGGGFALLAFSLMVAVSGFVASLAEYVPLADFEPSTIFRVGGPSAVSIGLAVALAVVWVRARLSQTKP